MTGTSESGATEGNEAVEAEKNGASNAASPAASAIAPVSPAPPAGLAQSSLGADEETDSDGGRAAVALAVGRAHGPSPQQTARTQRVALAWLAGAAVLVICWLITPVALGILLGALFAFTLEPVYKRLEKRTKSQKVAAIVVVVCTGLLLVGTFAALITLFVSRGVTFGSDLVADFQPNGTGTALILKVTKRLGRFGVNHDMIMDKVREEASSVAARAAETAGAIASVVAECTLALFFLLLTMHLFLRKWDQMLPKAEALFPLRPDYTRALFQEFRRVGRTTLQGTVVTGVAQGVLAGIGFAIAGIEDAAFFGAATAVASLIPAVGTMLIWVPAGIILIVTDHTGAGVFELVVAAIFVVGVSDYVIRPKLVGGDEGTPELLTFAALLGGVEVLGLQGLIVGPLLMSLALAVLRIYEREALARQRTLVEPSSHRAGIESALGVIRPEK